MPRGLDQDERQLVGEVRPPLRTVDLVAAEVREWAAVDLEDHALDPVELRERVHDLREAPHRDRRCLLVHERGIEVDGRNVVVDREAAQGRAGVDRGPEVRRALGLRRTVEQRLERPGAHGGRERFRPVGQEERAVVGEPQLVGHRLRGGRRGRHRRGRRGRSVRSSRRGSALIGAGPIGWAPLSAHAAVRTASTAVIAIRRFMGCLLVSGTEPMLEGSRNTGTPLVSRFGNEVGQVQREA